MRRLFLDNLELWLSAAGLLVVAGGAALAPPGTDVWLIAALTALGVSVIHGVIFWVVRRRQRQIRHQAIAEIKEVLADVVKNDLAAIGLYLPAENEATLREHLDGVHSTLAAVAAQVDELSEERLAAWRDRYAPSIASGTVTRPA
jgi:hypothetical protein